MDSWLSGPAIPGLPAPWGTSWPPTASLSLFPVTAWSEPVETWAVFRPRKVCTMKRRLLRLEGSLERVAGRCALVG